MPTAGTAVVQAGCDSIQLAVMQHDGAPTELFMTGRVFGESAVMPKCASIDGVDILSGAAGSPVVQHLPGGLVVPTDGTERLLAKGGPPVADISNRCASDDQTQRFDVYGVVITGHIDGGTFTAKCALADFGTSWPPALRVTCHKNVDEPSTYSDASVMNQTFMGMVLTQTTLYASENHDAGGALQSLDPTLNIIARREPFDPKPPIPPMTVSGWMTGVSENAPPNPPMSQLEFFAASNLLGSDLCPPAPVGPPMPGMVSSPAFIARATGNGGHGPFSTEIFVRQCYSEGM
jgi:hypothetical protein